MRTNEEPFIRDEDELTRVLMQIAIKNKDISFWFDNHMSVAQLMALKTALDLANEQILERLLEEMRDNE